MATFYKTTGLIGGGAWSGGTGNLDAIDGASLAAGDVALTYVAGRARQYLLKESVGAVENSPWVIIPDSNPGNLWWDLHNVGEEGIKYLLLSAFFVTSGKRASVAMTIVICFKGKS